MKYPLLIPTIGHGITDLIEVPKESLIIHIFGFSCISYISSFWKKTFLIISSIFHMKRDMPLHYSCLMHGIWLKYPIISKLYLSLYHTPLHYLRIYFYNPKNLLKK